jgi:HAD superfamily hydrolase (TIGR01509 family)
MWDLLHAVGGRLDRYIASNYPVWIEELRLAFALDECCEAVWASHHLGVRKPDPEFYLRLLARIGHRAESCLFVDDRAAITSKASTCSSNAENTSAAADSGRSFRWPCGSR